MKLYYSIGEVADMMGVNTSLLRFWETEFPQIKPHKNGKGTRYYTEKDITLIKEIYRLTKECGFTLDGARLQLKNKHSDGFTTPISQSLQDTEQTQKTNSPLNENQQKAIERLRETRQQLVALKQYLHPKQ